MNNCLYLLIKGAIIGFSIAAPIGPISILCMRLTLMDGLAVGLAACIGAATADACYGVIAGFGLTSISSFLISQKTVLSLSGGIFLGYLGIQAFRSQPTIESTPTTRHGILGAYSSTFALTLTNPMTIFAFLAVFAGVGIISDSNSYAEALSLVFGIFLGSSLWGLVLTGTVSMLRNKVTPTAMRWINIISGVVILAFAGGILYQIR